MGTGRDPRLERVYFGTTVWGVPGTRGTPPPGDPVPCLPRVPYGPSTPCLPSCPLTRPHPESTSTFTGNPLRESGRTGPGGGEGPDTTPTLGVGWDRDGCGGRVRDVTPTLGVGWDGRWGEGPVHNTDPRGGVGPGRWGGCGTRHRPLVGDSDVYPGFEVSPLQERGPVCCVSV